MENSYGLPPEEFFSIFPPEGKSLRLIAKIWRTITFHNKQDKNVVKNYFEDFQQCRG